MGRSINPVPQYLDNAGDIVVNGKMFYFESGTTTQKTTFADAAEEIPNAHPVPLDANGRLPNVFFTGTAKQVLTFEDTTQIWERDPVSADDVEGAFGSWLASETYDSGNIVTGSDGSYYRSNTNGNENNDPTSSTTWTRIRFLYNYNATQTYDIDDVVIQNNQLYISQVVANTGNSPDLADVTKWKNISNNFDLYVDSGAADAYVLTASSNTFAPQVYEEGMIIKFASTNTNAGASTVAVQGLPAEDLLTSSGGALIGGEVFGFIEARYNGTAFLITNSLPILNRGFIDGLITKNDGSNPNTDINIDLGQCVDSTNTVNINLTSILTKQIDVDWVEGTNQGGFPSGLTLAIDTWYHLFVIAKPDGTVDAGWDTSVNATNLLTDATDYTVFRLIASNLTDGSANIIKYFQDGDNFDWDVQPEDFAGAPSNTGLPQQISVPPTGVLAYVSVLLNANSLANILITALAQTNTPAADAINTIRVSSAGENSAATIYVRADSSSEIRQRGNNAGAALRLQTRGWIDSRGKQ